MEAWNIGIFTMMGIMATIIGIIVATRFLYVDNHYSKLIKELKKFISDHEKSLSDEKKVKDMSVDDYGSISVHIYPIQRKIGAYETKQSNNKRGVGIDFFALLSIVVIGLLAAQGMFKNEFGLLSLLLLLLFCMPLVHFIIHVRIVNQELSI